MSGPVKFQKYMKTKGFVKDILFHIDLWNNGLMKFNEIDHASKTKINIYGYFDVNGREFSCLSDLPLCQNRVKL